MSGPALTPAPRATGAWWTPLRRLIAIADRPEDDDDARLRKRAGIVAGYVTIVAPLGLPLAAPTPLVGWIVALVLSVWSLGNLVVLARTRRFERYVIALIAAGPPFVLLTTVLSGGVTHTPGLVWTFLTSPGVCVTPSSRSDLAGQPAGSSCSSER